MTVYFVFLHIRHLCPWRAAMCRRGLGGCRCCCQQPRQSGRPCHHVLSIIPIPIPIPIPVPISCLPSSPLLSLSSDICGPDPSIGALLPSIFLLCYPIPKHLMGDGTCGNLNWGLRYLVFCCVPCKNGWTSFGESLRGRQVWAQGGDTCQKVAHRELGGCAVHLCALYPPPPLA